MNSVHSSKKNKANSPSKANSSNQANSRQLGKENLTKHSIEHEMPIRVYYKDTDAGGVVYYANYGGFFEQGRTELLRNRGISPKAMQTSYQLLLPVVHFSVTYHHSACYDDVLTLHTSLVAIRGVRLYYQYKLYRLPTHKESDEKTLLKKVPNPIQGQFQPTAQQKHDSPLHAEMPSQSQITPPRPHLASILLLLATAETINVAVDAKTLRPRRLPQDFLSKLASSY